MSSLHAVGCNDSWRTLYRQGYRVVPVVIREIKQGRPTRGKGRVDALRRSTRERD